MKLRQRRKIDSQKAFVRWFIAIAPHWVTGIMNDRKIKYSKVRLVNKIRNSFAWSIESVIQEIDRAKAEHEAPLSQDKERKERKEAIKRQLTPKSGIVCSVCGLIDNRTFIKVVSSCEHCARYVCFRCECECRQDDMTHSLVMAVQLAKEAAEDYYRRQCGAPKRIDK